MAGKRFEGRVAVVTGGARGIGADAADLFAEGGASVVLLDLDKSVGDTARQIAERHGVGSWGAVVDITDAKAAEAAIEEAAQRFGGIHMLVNNAGITRDNLLHKMTEEDWDQVMAVHLRGNFLCTKYAQKFMVQQRFGKIVSLSSTAALGNRGQFNYSAAKAAIQGMTRTLSIELGPFNINVNCVAPGFVDTEMTRKTARRLGQDPEEYKAARAKAIPIGRVGVPRDISNVICFLCSEEASYVSGQIIYVRGGPETRR
ncbi:MAG: SDR family oxidoreductase [Reyranellaceae bacterium]